LVKIIKLATKQRKFIGIKEELDLEPHAIMCGKEVVTELAKMKSWWDIKKLIWIGHMKEARHCPFARITLELVKEILSFAFVV
jgi:hypothetical protein